MEDLAAYESEIHQLCGLHESLVADNPELTLDSETCPLCADMAAALRVIAHRDHEEEEGLRDQPGEVRSADGRRMRLRPKTPDEIAKAQRSRRAKAQATSHSM